jgi:hypothetical protein
VTRGSGRLHSPGRCPSRHERGAELTWPSESPIPSPPTVPTAGAGSTPRAKEKADAAVLAAAAVEISTEMTNGTAYRTSAVTSRTRELVEVDLPDPRHYRPETDWLHTHRRSAKTPRAPWSDLVASSLEPSLVRDLARPIPVSRPAKKFVASGGMPPIDQLIQSIDARIQHLKCDMASLQAARSALVSNGAAPLPHPPPRRHRRRGAGEGTPESH